MKRIALFLILSVTIMLSGAYTVKAYGSYTIYSTYGQKNYYIYQSGSGWTGDIYTWVYCYAKANCQSTAVVEAQGSSYSPLFTNKLVVKNGKSQIQYMTMSSAYRLYFVAATSGGWAQAYASWM